MTTTTVSPPKKYKPVPFIKGNPIFGNLLEFVRDRLSLLQRMADQGERNDLLSLLLQARDQSGQPMSMEGPLLLATLAQRVTFRLLPDQQIVADPIRHLTLSPKGEVKVTVTRR